MKETDSRECRNCHTWEAMTDEKQKRRAWKQHLLAQDDNMTCIDCHKGIAHRPVHELLEEDEDPYDGKPDPRALPVLVAEAEGTTATDGVSEEAAEETVTETTAETTAETATEESTTEEAAAEETSEEPAVEESAAGETQVASTGGDWGAIEGRKVVLFYPGQTSVEWMFKGSDHGGARALKKIGDRCGECHEGEQADMGQKIVTGEKAETMVIPDKRAAIEADVKAAHDGENLYLQVSWPDAPHTPAPFVDGGKMDPDNQVKLAIMLIAEENEFATQVGCWATCHHDSRYMPDHPSAEALGAAGDLATRLEASDGVTKYLQETRSEIEIKGKDGAPRGGWDKLLEQGEVDAAMGGNLFLDLIRFKSGQGELENGYVLERRVAQGGTGVSGQGQLADGTWTVELQIPMSGGGSGDLALDPGKTYTLGLAIHDDFTLARFHHVSLEYRLGFDSAEAEINAAKR
jgi:cytochrome c-type protein NapC